MSRKAFEDYKHKQLELQELNKNIIVKKKELNLENKKYNDLQQDLRLLRINIIKMHISSDLDYRKLVIKLSAFPEEVIGIIFKQIPNLKFKEICTCDEKAVIPEFLQCMKHTSIHYKNKGCYWCNYTDCSIYEC